MKFDPQINYFAVFNKFQSSIRKRPPLVDVVTVYRRVSWPSKIRNRLSAKIFIGHAFDLGLHTVELRNLVTSLCHFIEPSHFRTSRLIFVSDCLH